MTKRKGFIGVVLTVMLFLVCLLVPACSAKSQAGTYKFNRMTGDMGGMSVDLEVGEEFMGMITLTEDYMTITLNEDGTAVSETNAMGESMTINGTWTSKSSNEIDLTFEGETVACSCDGTTLSMEQDGLSVVLKK